MRIMHIAAIVLVSLLFLGCTAGRPQAENATNVSNASACPGCANSTEGNETPPAPNITASVPRPNCTDSDGMDFHTKGNVSLGTAAYAEDYCTDSTHLKEHYCVGGMATSEIVECPLGSACADGRCVAVETDCADSDGGNDIYNAGTLTLVRNLTSAEYLDKCLDGRRVKEYYCTRGGYAEQIVNCPDGTVCVQAACKIEVCMDGDNGYDIYTKSVASKGTDNRQDRCLDLASGTEYYCENDSIAAKNFTCPQRYRCEDGRCTK